MTDRPLMLIGPGLSQMEITMLDDGTLEVRCPACHEVSIAKPGATELHLYHDNDCPIERKIRLAQH